VPGPAGVDPSDCRDAIVHLSCTGCPSMTYLFKLARRGARFRALLVPALALAFAACNTDQFGPNSDDTSGIAPVPGATSFSVAFRGGIPFGTYALPTSEFGDRFNGAMVNIWPEFLRSELSQIKARGGKVILMFAGTESHYKDGEGHFSLSKWKARVDRFKAVDFSDYVADGTIIGHYIIDEPQDTYNWNGVPVSPSTVEEMARYSKTFWPNMPTIVRAEPGYMATWSGTYRYLDAAWAQYTSRRGDVGEYFRKNIAVAQQKGLALVAGLNFLDGGNPNLSWMNAAEVQQYGSALLANSYPCAFISWQYNATFLSQPGMGAALQALADKAEARPTVTCRRRAVQDPGEEEPPPPPPPDDPPQLPGISGIQLSVTGWEGQNNLYMKLTWSGAQGSSVRLIRNGVLLRRTTNDGKATTTKLSASSGTYSFKVCETISTRCSNIASVTFR